MWSQHQGATKSCLGLPPSLPVPFPHYHGKQNIYKMCLNKGILPSGHRSPSYMNYIFSGKMISDICFPKFLSRPHFLPQYHA